MKKFLSMVLALAMAMSLVTFAAPAAGAKDFTDDSSIQYKEAVDVISAIQIMDGYADASFNPSGTLTRGAAAKIICNMILGPTTASALPTNVNPFPDVTSDNVFAGYIAYCSEHSIISGYADGNFRPADSLSGYAFLKMLLCALGYDQKIEGYQGANWRVNVAKQALGIGLDDGLTTELDGSRIVTREEAALYAFNTLQSDLVEYDSKTTVAVNGATVTVGGEKFHSKESATQSTAFNNIDDGAMNNRPIVQFAEEYFNRLEREPKKNRDFQGNGDLFGRPSTKWTWKGVEVGTYKVAPAKTYDGGVKVSDIYNDLGLGGTAKKAHVFVNGRLAFYIDIERSNGDKVFHKDDQKKAYIATNQDLAAPGANVQNPDDVAIDGGNAKAYLNTSDSTRTRLALDYPASPVATWAEVCDKVGDGTIVEVFHNDADNRVVISAQSVYAGAIDSTHGKSSTKDAYIVIEEKKTNGTEDQGSFSKNGNDEYTTDEVFQEDEIVWFTYSAKDSEIGEVHRMQSVEGSLNRRVNEKSVTLDNVLYKFGEEYAMDVAENSLENASSYIAYTDSKGYMLWLEEADFAVDNFAVIQRISVEGPGSSILFRYLDGNGDPVWGGAGTSWDGARVRLLLSNGTERNYDLDESKRYRGDVGDPSTDPITDVLYDDNNNVVTDVIKESYDAGQVVRYTVRNDGTVRLNTVGAKPGTTGTVKTANTIDNATYGDGPFYVSNHEMRNLFRETIVNGQLTRIEVRADSDTIFVVKDPDGVKTYKGIRNVPNINVTGNANVDAYGYTNTNDTRPTAKLVYVIVNETNEVETSSKDITFLTDPSDMYEGDTGRAYYEYKAVINGVVQTEPVYVYEDTALVGSKVDPDGFWVSNSGVWTDGEAPSVITGDDYKTGSIVLNVTKYDNDDFLTEGRFSSRSVKSEVAQGIKKSSKTDEIKLDSHDDEWTGTLANNVNIFYVNDGIAKITVSEIKNDTDDMVYYTVDDDGDITNLFIVDYEDDDVYIERVTTSDLTGGASKANAVQITALGVVWNVTGNDAVEAQADFEAKKNSSRLSDIAQALNFQRNIIEAYVEEDAVGNQTLYVHDDDDQWGCFTIPAGNVDVKNDQSW